MPASRKYALEIRKSDLALVTLLNDGVVPEIKKDTYLIFELSEDARSITTKIVSLRELNQTQDIVGPAPFLMRLKK